MAADYKYEICFLVSQLRTLRPELTHVLGRFGANQKRWHVTPISDFESDKRLVRIFALFVVMHLFPQIWKRTLKQASVVFRKKLFEDIGGKDIFETIDNAIENMRRGQAQLTKAHKPYEEVRRGISDTDVKIGGRYSTLKFLCGKEQVLLLGNLLSREKGWLIRSIFKHSHRDKTPWFSVTQSPYIGSDEILVCDFDAVRRKLEAKAGKEHLIAEMECLSIKTMREHSLDRDDPFERDQLYACMAYFAGYPEENVDVRKASRLKNIIDTGIAAYVRTGRSTSIAPSTVHAGVWDNHYKSLQARLATLVADASEHTLRIEDVHDIRIQPHTRSALQLEIVSPPIPFSKLLTDTNDKVLVIAGKSGLGKTTSIRRLAWSHCKEFVGRKAGEVPFYLNCESSLLTQLKDMVVKAGRPIKDGDEALDVVSEMPCLFFIDGFDDAGSAKENILVEIRRLFDRSRDGTRIVITTRPYYIPNIAHERLFIPVGVDSKSRVDILTAHGVEDRTADRIVHSLVKQGASAIVSTPLLLRFVAVLIQKATVKNEEPQMPKTVELLIRKIVDEDVIPRIFSKPRIMMGMGLSREEWEHHLLGGCELLAYEMIVQGELAGYRQNRVVELFTQYFQSIKFGNEAGPHADKLFAMVTSEILEETSNKTFKFEHDLFRDFFAASYVSSYAGHFCNLLKRRAGTYWGDGMTTLLKDKLSDDERQDLVRCAIETINLNLAGCCLRAFRIPTYDVWKSLSQTLWGAIRKAVARFMEGEHGSAPELIDHVKTICDGNNIWVTDIEREDAIDFVLNVLEIYRTEYVLTSTYLDIIAMAPRFSFMKHRRRIVDLLRNERRGWFCNTYLFIIFAFDKVKWPLLSAETALRVPEVFCSYTSRPMHRYMSEDHFLALTQLLGPVLNDEEIALVDRLRKIDMDARQKTTEHGLDKELQVIRSRLLRIPDLNRFGDTGPHLDWPGVRATWPAKELLVEPMLDDRTFDELAQYMRRGLANDFTRLRERLQEIEEHGDVISRRQVHAILDGETMSDSRKAHDDIG